MPAIEFAGEVLDARTGESVLDCLLRNGHAIPHSCRSGVCHSCLLRAIDGQVPEQSQHGLKDTLRAQGYFLACTCRPLADLLVAAPGNEQKTRARITLLEKLSATVLRVRLTADGFDYRAGQFVALFREDGLARSYSLASLPSEPELELHVRRIAGGAMSQWFHETVRGGEQVWLQGPLGSCFYVEGNAGQPLLLVGAGTGLAPLYGVLRDALARCHRGQIWLFHGAVRAAGLYLSEELRALAAQYPQLHYVPTVLEGSRPVGGRTGSLQDCVLDQFPRLEGWRGYVCGDPALVNSFRKRIFLAGMALKDINSDAFVASAA